MNKSLQKSLEKESTEELFYNFKHDGLLNFEKKVVSGKILHSRKYSTHLLRREKSIITKSIDNQIREYQNTSKSAQRNRYKARRKIIIGIIVSIFSILLLLTDHFTKLFVFDYSSLLLISLSLILITYSLYTYKNKVQVGIQDDLEDCKILENKLTIIEREWSF